jgi:hypothetical protein
MKQIIYNNNTYKSNLIEKSEILFKIFLKLCLAGILLYAIVDYLTWTSILLFIFGGFLVLITLRLIIIDIKDLIVNQVIIVTGIIQKKEFRELDECSESCIYVNDKMYSVSFPEYNSYNTGDMVQLHIGVHSEEVLSIKRL